jgi:hypothetical protein
MAYRAKCPTCGRRQPAQLSEAGQIIFCAACGTRFLVELEQISDTDTTLPDVDFFPTLTLPQPSALTPATVAPPPPDSPTQVPHPLPSWQSVLVDPAPKSDPNPVALEAASRSAAKWLSVVLAIVILGITFSLGVAVGYEFSQRQQPSIAAVPLSSRSVPTTLPAIASNAQPPVSIPTSQPIAVVTPATEPAPAAPAPPVTDAIPPTPPPPAMPAKFQPVRPQLNNEDLDEHIGKALDDGVTYLLSQFQNGTLRRYRPNDGTSAGLDALAVYALLHAAEANHDLRLGVNSPLVGQMLEALKKMPMDRENSTYSRSLRAAALSVYHRVDDKQALRDDCAWLVASAQNGAYTYEPVAAGSANRRGLGRFGGGWDNSNSQYGALGVWAALEAGVEVSNSYWSAVQKHWLGCQLPDGEWGYTGYGAMGRLSMTVAGITTLLVTEDQLDARAVVSSLGHPPFTPALQRGLNWLEFGDNSVRLPQTWRTYNLFGLERAALASGLKYFGDHDWYRELARQQLSMQDADGSWTDSDQIIGTSYTLLFLSRGRHPIFMNKLRFDGYWANRPRDIANLAHYASTVLERPINWQVVSFKSDWTDWMDSPVLFIASHEALKFSDADCAKLRAYAENGGLLFTHADGGSPEFNKTIAELSRRLFPQYPLADLPPTHPIFSTLYKIKETPRMQGVSNGSRLLLLHSPEDLNKYWQLRDPVEKPVNFQTGINVFIYAAGKANLRNRLKTPVVPDPNVNPILTTTIAQIRHMGDWNPEPAGLPRFARLFLGQTSVKVNIVETDPQSLDADKMPLAHLTGTTSVHFTADELKGIHDYVNNGGTLLIDACGGSADFEKSVVSELLPRAFPQSLLSAFPADNPILTGSGAGMSRLTLKLRPYRAEIDGATTEPLQYLSLGKGQVILSPVDISTGLLGTNIWPVNGYEPDAAYAVVRNVLLAILEK